MNKELYRNLLGLAKIRITIAVTITTAVGYILFSGSIDINMLTSVISVFILACGSSAFNHIQERRHDSLMLRTKKRPLVNGNLKLSHALIFASAMSLIGLALLYFLDGYNEFLLGVSALVWYNGIYTPLKRLSSLAVVPGALIGAIPPAIGWVAAGGSIMDPQIWVVSLFIFIWQIPHFWLLLLLYDEEYKSAGYPTLTELINSEQLTRVTYMWIVALVASVMIIPMFGLTNIVALNILLLIAGARLVWNTRKLIGGDSMGLFRNAFKEVNIFVLIVLLVISADRLISV